MSEQPLRLRNYRRAAPGSARERLHTVREAVVLVVGVDPRRAALVLGVQAIGVLATVGQVFAARTVLDGLAATGGARVAVAGLDVGARVLAGVLLMAFLVLLSGVLAAVAGPGGRVLGEHVTQRTTAEVVRIAGSVPLATYESPEFYDLLQRVRAAAAGRSMAVTQALVTTLVGAVAVVAMTASVLVIAPWITPVLALAALPVVWASRRTSRAEHAFATAEVARLRHRLYLQSVLTGREQAGEVRAYALVDHLVAALVGADAAALGRLRRHAAGQSRVGVAAAAVTGVVVAGSMVAVVLLVAAGTISLGTAAAALLAVRFLSARVQSTSSSAGKVHEASLFLGDLSLYRERYGGWADGAPAPRARSGGGGGGGGGGGEGDASVLDLTAGPDRCPVPGAGPAMPAAGPLRRELAAHAVGYRYEGAARDALVGVDLVLRPGEVLALVGENGSGKSTLAKVLAGLLPPTAGAVTWDGVDLRALEPASVREQVAVVFQDFVRWEMTAHDNVALGRVAAEDGAGIAAEARHGRPDGTDGTDGGERERAERSRRVAAAVDQVGLTRELDALPQGAGTLLSRSYEGGADLSGGQWQRLAVARALFRDAPVLLLDEPSAALDPRSEAELFGHVRTLLAGRTVVMVSHRLASVRSADRIAVLSEGRVVEVGDHTTLVAAGGLYAELFALQAAGYRATA